MIMLRLQLLVIGYLNSIEFPHFDVIIFSTIVISRIIIDSSFLCSNCSLFVAMDERLSSYALIARAAIGATIPLLTELFSVRVMRLHQVLY